MLDAGGLLEKVRCENRLRDFVRVMWHAVEPGRRMTHGWTMDAICEHLEACADGQIKRLIINVPPGFAKSVLLCVYWPAWMWGPRNQAHTRFLCAAYSQSLTVRDNVRFKQVVQSDLYQRYWGGRFALSDTDASKIKFGNDKTGWKLASSVGGTITGERADFVLIDDPNAVNEAESEKVRTSTNQWLREVMPTRLSDPARSGIICIQQRTHEEDATGTLLALDDEWCHLMVPMEYDPDRHCTTSIGWTDPRSEPGELAWPERFPREVVERDKRIIGPYAVSGQFQQMPAPRGGAILSRDWWQTWGDPDGAVGAKFPMFSLTIAVLDGAYTTKEENDPSGMMVLGVFADERTGNPQVMLARAWTERLALHDLVHKVDSTCKRYRVDTLLVENKANGISVAQELRRLFGSADYGLLMVDPAGRDKVARAHAVAPMLAEGLVWRPVTDWSDAVVDQCAIFPRGSHDEYVDCLAHGLKWLRDMDALQRGNEVRERESMLSRAPPKMAPLYRV